VELIDGVVKVVPVPRELPPVIAAYQLMVPVELAVKVIVPGPQLVVVFVLVTAGA
jgi:hypothetical protein